jgi:hypothetical protein
VKKKEAVSKESDIERKECSFCEFSVSHSGADEDSILLGCSGYQGDVTSQKTCV